MSPSASAHAFQTDPKSQIWLYSPFEETQSISMKELNIVGGITPLGHIGPTVLLMHVNDKPQMAGLHSVGVT